MADTKISALTSASTIDGTEALPLVQSSTTKKATAAAIAAYSRNNATVYKALLSYNGITVTAVVLHNTLGGTPTWSVPTANTFRATLSSPFLVDKTFISPIIFEFGGTVYVVSAFRAADNIITFKPFLVSDGTQPGSLPSFNSIPIYITVNP